MNWRNKRNDTFRKDGQLFYKLWLPLLDYVNEKCKVNKNVKDMANTKSLNPQEVKEIANVLWDDISLIDQYLIDQRTDISDEHKEIISDGLVMPYNIVIGKNMAKQFKDVYMSAKKSGTLIKSL